MERQPTASRQRTDKSIHSAEPTQLRPSEELAYLVANPTEPIRKEYWQKLLPDGGPWKSASDLLADVLWALVTEEFEQTLGAMERHLTEGGKTTHMLCALLLHSGRSRDHSGPVHKQVREELASTPRTRLRARRIRPDYTRNRP